MKIIFGFGNPGKKYQFTRHNIGFLAIDNYLHDKEPIACQSKFNAEICELHFGPQKVLFVKPQTFMNDSGSIVSEIANFYKVNVKNDILIIQDEVDLPLGSVREAYNSSAAGHKGVVSSITSLGTQEFHRLRIGIETRNSRLDLPTDAFVLQEFTPEELTVIKEKVFPEIEKRIDEFIQQPNQTKTP